MGIRLGSNIASLTAQRLLGKSTDDVSKSFERLSSGLRINSGSDDAAGLAVATSLQTDARIFGQGMRNINDGISALSIAEGALQELSSITMRQQELAEQAANGSYSLAQRKALHAEAKALTDEYNRIIGTTTFNGINLLSSQQNISIQAGAGQNATIQTALGNGITQNVGNGTFSTSLTLDTINGYTPYVNASDVNGDGFLDLIIPDYSNGGGTGNSISIFVGNGDGTFRAYVTYQTGGTGPKDLQYVDLNGDGYKDIVVTNYTSASVAVLMGNSNGTFGAPTQSLVGITNPTSIELGDVNGDGKLDLIQMNFASKINVALGNGNGTFQAQVSYFNAGGSEIELGDFNSDGILDILSINQNNNTYSVLTGNGNGTFKLNVSYAITGGTLSDLNVADINQDGILDFMANSYAGNTLYVGLGNGDGTFSISAALTAVGGPRGGSLVDVNGDGYLDVVTTDNGMSVFLGNGDGTFRAQITSTGSLASPWYAAAGDFDRNGTMDFVMGDHSANPSLFIMSGNGVRTGNATHVNLLTQADARSAITTLQAQLERITTELGNIGAAQSRYSVAKNVLSVARENYAAAGNRIMDVDVAEESSRLVSSQIRQQMATAILAQANQEPALVLKLLQ